VETSVAECASAYAAEVQPDKETERNAVQAVLNQIKQKVPGKSVELRIPPYAAIQIIQGTNHRRGTPAAVVEMNAKTLVLLAIGKISWEQATEDGLVSASGERSNLSDHFPV
jgi:hypothetical protein